MATTWTDSLAIGVPAIDAEHRELFARVASFEAALDAGGAVELGRTFAFLREYALVHFAKEEALMREVAYPRLEEHRGSHARFVERLSALVQDHGAAGARAFVPLRTRNWIVVWLLDHVAGEDAAIGRHVRARRAAELARRA